MALVGIFQDGLVLLGCFPHIWEYYCRDRKKKETIRMRDFNERIGSEMQSKTVFVYEETATKAGV